MTIVNPLALALPVSLDRAAHHRKDTQWLERTVATGDARLIPVWRSQSLVHVDHEARLLRLPLTSAEAFGKSVDDLVFLGLEGEVPTFAVDVSENDAPDPERLEGGSGAAFSDLRQVAALLPASDGNLAAYSRAVATWHRNHRHCGRCGTATKVEQAGHVRRCDRCDIELFPRTDPAVIMLVHDGETRCLLGRQASWPPGVYSTLAGFVEPGESLEMAVAREVVEETGVEVSEAHYHSSQPWPFPTSVMLGFMARADRTNKAVVLDDELEDARWFEAEELQIAIRQREIRLPPPMSISRRLVDDWLATQSP